MPAALLGILLPALIPPVADAIGMAGKWLFGGKGEPQTVDDRVKLTHVEAEMLQARGKFLAAEGFGDLSAWAESLNLSNRPWLSAYVAVMIVTPRAMREATRPALAWLVVLAAVGLAIFGNSYATLMIDMAASVYSLYFGDRAYSYIKGRIGGSAGK